MIKISIVRQVSDLCLDIINVLKFIMGSNAGFGDVLSILILSMQILRGDFRIAS